MKTGAVSPENEVTSTPGVVRSFAQVVETWRRFGATHMVVNTSGAGYSSLDEHIDAMRLFLEVTSG